MCLGNCHNAALECKNVELMRVERFMLQVTDGRVVLGVDNGVEMLTKITAAGCSVTALIAGFVAVAPTEPLLATAAGLAVFG